MTLALDIHSLRKSYNNGFEALKGIDLQVEAGDFFALLGPNGAGKSTTIGVICSLVKKTSGKVSIFGLDIDTDFSRAKQHIGVVPQEFNFNIFEKVQDVVLSQAGYFGIPRNLASERSEHYLNQLGLWEKRDVQARHLSGGMKRRLMIARALINDPELLILDEPTAGVDIELRRSMWEFLTEINQNGTTIILTTHYLEEAESLCRNVAIIDEGKIVENTSVKSLLKQLNKEIFILDTREAMESAPVIDGCEITRVDATTLEASVTKGQSLNALFEVLNAENIDIVSMRNKTNRLEELFVSRINAHKAATKEAEAS